MRKILLITLFTLLLTGCKETYNSPEEVISKTYDAYSDIAMGKEVDIDKLCNEIAYGSYIEDCIVEMEDVVELFKDNIHHSVEITVEIKSETLKEDSVKISYPTDLTYYEVEGTMTSSFIKEEGSTPNTSTWDYTFIVGEKDGRYYIFFD